MLVRARIYCFLVTTALVLLIAADGKSTTFDWIGPGGVAAFEDAANWSPAGGPPGAGDDARFGDAGIHTVTIDPATAVESDQLIVEKGDYTFRSLAAGTAQYNVSALFATNAISEATLRLGEPGLPVDLNLASDLRVDFGSTLTVDYGSSLAGEDLFLGTSGGNNVVLVDGAGDSLDMTGVGVLGANGASATLTFANGATGSFGKDLTLINFTSTAGTEGHLSVQTAAQIDTAGIAIGQSTSTTASQSASLTVSGQDSTVTQTGAVGLLVGVANNPNLTADVTIGSNGVFHSGTGNVRFRGTGGRLTVGAAGTFNANGPLSFTEGAKLTVAGTLNASSGLDYSDGEITSFSGDIKVEGGGFVPALEPNGDFFFEGAPESPGLFNPPAVLTLGAGATFDIAGNVQVGGSNRFADMRVEAGAQVSSGNVDIGSLTVFSPWSAFLEITGNNTMWDVQGTLTGQYGNFDVSDQATLLTDEAELSNRVFDITGSSDWDNDGVLSVSGGATLNVNTSATVDTASALIGSGQVLIDTSGVWNITDTLELTADADLELDNSAMLTSQTAFIGTGVLGTSAIVRAGADWHNTGEVRLGNLITAPPGPEGEGEIRANAGGHVQIDGPLWLRDTGTFRVNLGTATLNGPVIDQGGTFVFSAGTLHLNDPSATLLANPDGLYLGTLDLNASNINTNRILHMAGSTVVTPGASLTVFGQAHLSRLTISPGGVVDYQLGVLDVSGPLQAATGSVINIAGGNTELGDATAVNGVFIGGELHVHTNVVTLGDADQVVFDSGALVTLGDGPDAPGQIIAANGITLDFGGNITGNGILRTADDPTRPTINNGSIVGDSMDDPITLTGYVKGVGTCDNCVVTGTDAPGFSPATVVRGSVSYQGVLEMEIGGLGDGDYDRIDHLIGTGEAELGGEIVVQLLEGYSPAVGDAFTLLTATGGVSGVFATEALPQLSGGLLFDISYGANDVSLAVVGLAGDYNYDGTVNVADYTVWRDTLGQMGTGLAADGNGDAVVDNLDYTVWKTNFGQTELAAVSQLAMAVPEPDGCVGLLLAIALFNTVARSTWRVS